MREEKPSSRNRSGFGQFQLKRSKTGPGVDYSKVVARPKASDMAAMMREGKSVHAISLIVGLSESTVKHRISEAGWSATTGEVRKPRK